MVKEEVNNDRSFQIYLSIWEKQTEVRKPVTKKLTEFIHL